MESATCGFIVYRYIFVIGFSHNVKYNSQQFQQWFYDSEGREEILHWFSSITWTVELQNHWFWAFAISQIGYLFFIKLTMKISELTRMDETKEGEDKQKHSSYESVLTCNLKQHYTGLFSYHSFCTSIRLFSKHLLIITHRRIFSPSSESKD